MNTSAKTYKEHGYTHVLIMNENGRTPYISKGFKTFHCMKTFRDNLSLIEYNSGCFEFTTVNKAIKKGY